MSVIPLGDFSCFFTCERDDFCCEKCKSKKAHAPFDLSDEPATALICFDCGHINPIEKSND